MILRLIPNIITVLRLIIVVPFLYCLLNSQYLCAFYLFTVAGLSDGIDGYLARQFNWISEFGSFADPLADKILMLSSFVALGYMGVIPSWLMVLVICRDLVIMMGVSCWYWLFRKIDFEPTIISKINTALQILLIFLLLYELAYQLLPDLVITVAMMSMIATTIISFAHYVWVWSVKAYNQGTVQ